jgi:hypothetical protein
VLTRCSVFSWNCGFLLRFVGQMNGLCFDFWGRSMIDFRPYYLPDYRCALHSVALKVQKAVWNFELRGIWLLVIIVFFFPLIYSFTSYSVLNTRSPTRRSVGASKLRAWLDSIRVETIPREQAAIIDHGLGVCLFGCPSAARQLSPPIPNTWSTFNARVGRLNNKWWILIYRTLLLLHRLPLYISCLVLYRPYAQYSNITSSSRQLSSCPVRLFSYYSRTVDRKHAKTSAVDGAWEKTIISVFKAAFPFCFVFRANRMCFWSGQRELFWSVFVVNVEMHE